MQYTQYICSGKRYEMHKYSFLKLYFFLFRQHSQKSYKRKSGKRALKMTWRLTFCKRQKTQKTRDKGHKIQTVRGMGSSTDGLYFLYFQIIRNQFSNTLKIFMPLSVFTAST